jgi:hypothetical protein
MRTPRACSVELRAGPRCDLERRRDSSPDSAGCDAAKSVLEQFTRSRLLEENVTDSNSPAILQSVSAQRVTY